MQLKLVSTESLLFLYLNTKVGFQQSRRSVSFSVKEEMSTTDEGPSHPHNDLNQVAHLLDGFSQSLVPPGRVSVCDQAHDNLPNQVPSLVSALSQDVAPPYPALRAPLAKMYTLSNFQRYQALQSIPVLTDQRPLEPWRREARFLLLRTYYGSSFVRSHLLTESFLMSSGQYKEELTPWNLALLRIWGYFSCVSQL